MIRVAHRVSRLGGLNGYVMDWPSFRSLVTSASATDTSSAYDPGSTAPSLGEGQDIEFSNYMTSFLDGVHTWTGLPWWGSLALGAVGIRTALLPLTFQGQKAVGSLIVAYRQASRELKYRGEIGSEDKENISFSELSEHVKDVLKEMRAPHPMWAVVSPVVNVSVLVYGLYSVRQMGFVSWPGFESEGPWWASDLTLPAVDVTSMTAPLGMQGAIMPAALVLLLHMSIRRMKPKPVEDGMHETDNQKLVRWTLTNLSMIFELLTIPVLIGSLTASQAPLYYWTSGLGTSLLLQQTMKPTKPQVAGFHLDDEKEKVISEEARYLLAKAAQHHAAKRPTQAISCLMKALKIHPNCVNTLFALGQVHGTVQQWKDSDEYYYRALKEEDIDPSLEQRALFGRGIALTQLGDIEKALDCFTRASDEEYRGQNVRIRALISISTLEKRRGNIDLAIEALEEACELDPRVQSYLDPLKKELQPSK